MGDIVKELEQKLDSNKSVEPQKCEPSKYRRVDCEGGYLTDSIDIKNYKTAQKQEILANCLLGDFNNEGNYIVGEKILQALVGIEKILLTNYKNIYFCKSSHIFECKKELQFCVVIKEPEKEGENATAILKIMENISHINGYIQNTNTFVVASYSDIYDGFFYSKMKKVFNIIEVTDKNGRDKIEEIKEIQNRISYIKQCEVKSEADMATAQMKYYFARIEKLKQLNQEGIIVSFDELKKKASVFLDENSPQYYVYLNQLLDQSIDMELSKHPEKKLIIKDAMEQIDEPYRTEIETIIDKSKEALSQIDKKQEIKKVVAKKPEKQKESGGKSSGSSSKGGSSSSKAKSGGEKKKPKATKFDPNIDVNIFDIEGNEAKRAIEWKTGSEKAIVKKEIKKEVIKKVSTIGVVDNVAQFDSQKGKIKEEEREM